jgi:DNA repair exonuclease SbcCD ATPase subunit
MFPKEQQVLMVRAMDAADETWSEKDVLADARRRQSALRSHLQEIETERSQKLQSVAARVEKAQAEGKRRLDEIDSQIAEFQKLRQEAVAATTSALTEFELAKKQTEEAAEKARRGITTVINALSDLITFFTGGDSKPAAKP